MYFSKGYGGDFKEHLFYLGGKRGSDGAGGFSGVLRSLFQGDFRALVNGESIGVPGD